MRGYFQILLYILASVFNSPRQLAAENIALRHQILVLKRKHRGRIRLRGLDRVILGWLSRLGPAVADAIIIVKPETLVRWHRQGFSALWRWKSGSIGGRPPIEKELTTLILRMAAENPLWGAPRIHGELLKLGFELAQSTVSNYLRRHPHPRGQTWKTFIENHREALAAIDLFVIPTIGFKLMYVRRTLKSYAQYYNRTRTHISLGKDSPIHRPVQNRGNIIRHPHLAGLHHEYARAG